MKVFGVIVVLVLVIEINVSVQAQIVPGDVLGPTYLATLYGITCNGTNPDETSTWNSMTSTISGAGGGWIDLSACTNYVALSTAQIIMPANVHIRGCGMGTYNPGTGHFYRPRCGLDLRFNDPHCKIYLANPGVNTFEDVSFIDGGTDVAPFFCANNAASHFNRVSFQGTKSCAAGTCSGGVSNQGILFGGVNNCYSTTDPTCYFSGYASSITDAVFDQMGIAISSQTIANQVFMHDIYVTHTSGNPSGAAIILNGGGLPQNAADYLSGMFIEVISYKYGIEWQTATNSTFANVACWDGTSMITTACLHFDSGSMRNHGDLAFYNSGTVNAIQDDNGNNDIFDPYVGWFGSVATRHTVGGTYAYDMNHSHNLSSGVAQTVLSPVLGTDSWVGGTVNYTIFAKDGAHHVCSVSGIINFTGINSNGIITTAPTLGTATGEQTTCSSGQTLTDTWTLTGAAPIHLQVKATTSITTTSFFIYYTWNYQGLGIPTE